MGFKELDTTEHATHAPLNPYKMLVMSVFIYSSYGHSFCHFIFTILAAELSSRIKMVKNILPRILHKYLIKKKKHILDGQLRSESYPHRQQKRIICCLRVVMVAQPFFHYSPFIYSTSVMC